MIHARFTVVVATLMVAATLCAAGTGSHGARRHAQNTIITLRLSVSERTAIVKIPNKGCASVTTSEGQTLRVYGEVTGDDVDTATWLVAADTEPCAPSSSAGRNKLAAKGSAQVTAGDTKLQIDLLMLSPLAATTGGQWLCNACRVTCQGTTFCGCEVETACGRCCCPEACGCQQSVKPVV